MTRYGHGKGRCTFRGVQPLRPAAVLRVVVHEHVVADGHQRTVDGHLVGDHHLWTNGIEMMSGGRKVQPLCGYSPESVACRADCRHSSGNSGCT